MVNLIKDVVYWLYVRLVDEVYFPKREEWQISKRRGEVLWSSNTSPYQEKRVIGTVSHTITTIQGEPSVTITIKPLDREKYRFLERYKKRKPWNS